MTYYPDPSWIGSDGLDHHTEEEDDDTTEA